MYGAKNEQAIHSVNLAYFTSIFYVFLFIWEFCEFVITKRSDIGKEENLSRYHHCVTFTVDFSPREVELPFRVRVSQGKHLQMWDFRPFSLYT